MDGSSMPKALSGPANDLDASPGLCQSFAYDENDIGASLSSPWLHTLGNTEFWIVTESSCIRKDAFMISTLRGTMSYFI
jgi:hypothetical protein